MYGVSLQQRKCRDIGGLRWKQRTAGQEIYMCYPFCVWYLWLLQQRKVQWAASPLLRVPATFHAFKLQGDTWSFLKLLLIWENCILSEGRWTFSLRSVGVSKLREGSERQLRDVQGCQHQLCEWCRASRSRCNAGAGTSYSWGAWNPFL